MSMIYTPALIGKKLSVVDELLLLNPLQIPILSLLGGFSKPVSNTQHEWNEDEMYAFASITGGLAATGTTTLNVATGNGILFRVGHIIQMGNEMMKVTAISTDALTITRSYAGTSAATYADGTVAKILFTEGVEGAVARAARSKPRVNKFNYTQIIDDTVEVSGSAVEVNQYGLDGLYEYEKQKKLAELAFQLERALLDGIRYQSGNIRQFGGIKYWVTTNVADASAADVSKLMLNNAVQSVANAAGLSAGRYVFMVSPIQRRKLGTLDAASLLINRQDTGRGETIKTLTTDLGEYPVVANPNMNADEILFLDLNRMKVRPLGSRSFTHEYLGKVGDSYNGLIVGEYTFEFKEEKAHAMIKNLKTT